MKKLTLTLLSLTIFHIGTMDCQPKSNTFSTSIITDSKEATASFTESCKKINKSLKNICKSMLTIAATLIIWEACKDYKDYTKHGNPVMLISDGALMCSLANLWYECGLGYPFIPE